ncbi:MAG: XTP/dITP diphosphatase [Peptococcaceae bacterium]|nr:XTP/dITP diphosphatase [Peptococcaceae bacterium]
MKILLATRNKGKVDELAELIAKSGLTTGGYTSVAGGQANGPKAGFSILSLNDFPDLPEIEESGLTFAENALHKARVAFGHTKIMTLADDSGLEVDALNGAPGVYSARYAGEPKDDERNIQKLLADLQGVPEEARTARFRCSLAVIIPDGREYLLEGVVEGRILQEKKGKGGFGYDPVFYLPELGKTMAELEMEEKNTISHRAQAFRQLIPLLEEVLSGQNLGKVL